MRDPLITPLEVTVAVKLPTVVGAVPNVTVSDVAVAPVTVPVTPLLNATMLAPGVVALKPKPLSVMVDAPAAKSTALLVTAGLIVATVTDALVGKAVMLNGSPTSTVAVRAPAVGTVSNVTVNVVAVAPVTVPVPLLSSTVLFASVVPSKPKPFIVSVPLAARVAALVVITGMTEPTLTRAPLDCPSTVTLAVKSPTAVGLAVKSTVSIVAVARRTVPTAPLLNTTVLFAGVVSNNEPLISMDNPLMPRAVALVVTTGATSAT